MASKLEVYLLISFDELAKPPRPHTEVGFYYKGNLVKFITFKELTKAFSEFSEVLLLPFKD